MSPEANRADFTVHSQCRERLNRAPGWVKWPKDCDQERGQANRAGGEEQKDVTTPLNRIQDSHISQQQASISTFSSTEVPMENVSNYTFCNPFLLLTSH